MRHLRRIRNGLRRRGVPFLLVAIIVFAFYLWTASAGLPFAFGEELAYPYNLLTRALLKGQLHLLVEPNPELFELADPYEPNRNARTRLNDASLYHGRYYLYFGVVPALVAFVPWRLMGLGDLPEPAAAFAFAFGAFVFSALVMRRLWRAHTGLPSGGHRLLAFLVLAVANVVPFVLRGSRVYEVAIVAGLFFTSVAAWLLVAADEVPSWKRLALAGSCLGLAVGCRPNLLVAAAVLPLLALGLRFHDARRRVNAAIAILLPLAASLFLLGLYNQARFGSWSEFGTRYQLAGSRRISWFDPRAVPPNLYYLFLAPPTVSPDFPLVRPSHAWPFSSPPPDGHFLDERTTGLLWQAPFVLILAAGYWILPGVPVRGNRLLRWRLAVLTMTGLLLPLATSLAFSSVAMRFEVDFATFLVVPALVLWTALLRDRHGGRWVLTRTVAVAAFAWSLCIGAALSLTGATDALREENPELHVSLSRRIEPLRVAIGRVLDRDGRITVRLRVAFPERLNGTEPLLSWGRIDEYDVVWVKATDSGRAMFTLDTAASRAKRSSEPPTCDGVPIPPGRFREIVFELDRVKRIVRMSIEGRTACELGGRLVGLHQNRIWPGRGPRGHGAPALGGFSGAIIPEAMSQAGPPGLESLPPIARAPASVVEHREERPPGALGQLRVVAGRRGADILTRSGWRWIPLPAAERVWLDRRVSLTANDLWQPLLVSGNASAADAVLVRRRAAGRCSVALARWDGRWSVTAEGTSTPLGQGNVAVTLDRVHGVAIATVDGREVLRAVAPLMPLRGEGLHVGRMPPGVPIPGAGRLRR